MSRFVLVHGAWHGAWCWERLTAEHVITALYHDCPRPLAEWAAARLRPQGRLPNDERCELDALPAVPAQYVVASEDRAIAPGWSRRAARERLGCEPVELPGGHSPFLARPAALADVLTAL